MNQPQQVKRSQTKKWRWILLGFMFVWVVLLFRQCQCTYQSTSQEPAKLVQREGWIPLDSSELDSAIKMDSVGVVVDTSRVDTVTNQKKTVKRKIDTLKTSAIKLEPKKSIAMIDTLFLWADPWGGRHFGSVTISLHCKQTCEIMYRLASNENLQAYTKPFELNKNDTLFFYGQNELGERSPEIMQYYKIEAPNPICQDRGGEPIGKDGKDICVDRYEWPNQKNSRPQVYVTQSDAVKLCASVNKRLCTVSEWKRACMGPNAQPYPYAANYVSGYCPDKERESRRSGHNPTCRSFEGLYDLAGNVWEWTATEKEGREGFYYAVGGAWDSGNKARCDEQKYSFYPQNKYVFLGFRCCWEE